MLGDFDEKIREALHFFEKHEISPGLNGRAADLGCGPGAQSLALAQLGYDIIGVDVSSILIGELRKHAEERGLTAKTVCCDVLDAERWGAPQSLELVTCFGDTLTHLSSREQVKLLFEKVHDVLVPGGRSIWTFRDYTRELTDTDRILPVRSDETRIMTAFLEYKPEVVVVSDIVYEKSGAGWQLHKSSYLKLRLEPEWVRAALEEAGFALELDERDSRFVQMIARKMG
nr:class I SAM-dependent methyltransferase [Paenibacillus hamazuiensis]